MGTQRPPHDLSGSCFHVCPYWVLWEPPTGLNPTIQSGDELPFSVPPTKTIRGGAGILTCLSLRFSASPLDPTNPGKINFTQEPLGLRQTGFSPVLSLLELCIIFFQALHQSLRSNFTALGMLAYRYMYSCYKNPQLRCHA